MEKGYQKTIYACFIGYIVQAIVNNFVPLLFVTFHDSYGIPLSKITLLVTFNFGLQLLVDLLSVGFVDRIGYRASMLLAHGLSAVRSAAFRLVSCGRELSVWRRLPCGMAVRLCLPCWRWRAISVVPPGRHWQVLFPVYMGII